MKLTTNTETVLSSRIREMVQYNLLRAWLTKDGNLKNWYEGRVDAAAHILSLLDDDSYDWLRPLR